MIENINASAVMMWVLFSLTFIMQDNADPVLLGDHDVALASIEKVVVGE